MTKKLFIYLWLFLLSMEVAAERTYYVRCAQAGCTLSDGNETGTITQPYNYLQRAITEANKFPSEAIRIYVANGTDLNSDDDWRLSVSSGSGTIEIIGGYDFTSKTVTGVSRINKGIGSSYPIFTLANRPIRFSNIMLNGNNATRCVSMNANATFSNCVFINGKTTADGGAILLYGGTLTLDNCTFINNSALSGGAILNSGGTIICNHSTFMGNSGTIGAIDVRQGSCRISNSLLIGNGRDIWLNEPDAVNHSITNSTLGTSPEGYYYFLTNNVILGTNGYYSLDSYASKAFGVSANNGIINPNVSYNGFIAKITPNYNAFTEEERKIYSVCNASPSTDATGIARTDGKSWPGAFESNEFDDFKLTKRFNSDGTYKISSPNQRFDLYIRNTSRVGWYYDIQDDNYTFYGDPDYSANMVSYLYNQYNKIHVSANTPLVSLVDSFEIKAFKMPDKVTVSADYCKNEVKIAFEVPTIDPKQTYTDNYFLYRSDENAPLAEIAYTPSISTYEYVDDLSTSKIKNFSGSITYILRRSRTEDGSTFTRSISGTITLDPKRVTNTTVSLNTDKSRNIVWQFSGSSACSTFNVSLFRKKIEDTNWGDPIVSGADLTSYQDVATLPSCEVYQYKVVSTNGGIKSESISASFLSPEADPLVIESFDASTGYFANRIELKWKIKSGAANKFRLLRLFADPAYGTDTTEVVDIVHDGKNIYTYNDYDVEPSIIYRYILQKITDCNNQIKISGATDPVIGFRNPTATLTGRVTYEGGATVEGVTVNAETKFDFRHKSVFFSADKTVKGIIKEKPGMSLTGGDEFTFQAWIKRADDNTGRNYIIEKGGNFALLTQNGQLEFYFRGNTVSIPFNYTEFCHLTCIKSGNQLTIMLHPSDGSVKIQTAQFASFPNTDLSGSTIYFGKHPTAANPNTCWLDEVRFWNRALDSSEVAINYNKYLAGDENGLKCYIRFDEGFGLTAFDLSYKGLEYNKNDMELNGSYFSDVTPSIDQLGLRATTDANGNYMIPAIPYLAKGNTYRITPMKGVHKFDPNEQLVFVNDNANVLNKIDFKDISSFTISGQVTYSNTTIPAKNINLEIDGNAVVRDKNVVATDQNGKFAIQVPIGEHKIGVSSYMHVFEDGGIFPSATAANETWEFKEPLDGMEFKDSTYCKLAGRIAGGLVEKEKPLGFGLSTNNLGISKLVIEYDGDYTINSLPKTQNSTFTINYDTVTITTNPNTGEFEVLLPPGKYNIVDISVENDNENKPRYDFSKWIGTNFTLDILKKDSSVYVSQRASLENDTAKVQVEKSVYTFNKRLDFIVITDPIITVTPLQHKENAELNTLPEATGFGEKSVTLKNSSGNDTLVSLYDSTGYAAGYPIFVQSHFYAFKLNAREEYVNLSTTSDKVDSMYVIPVKKGRYVINNELCKLNADTVQFDSTGTSYYVFAGGEPNLLDNHTKTLTIIPQVKSATDSTVYTDAVLKYGSAAANNSLVAVVLGSQESSGDFITKGPDLLECILRDPPGTNSTAYREKGTVSSTSHSFDIGGYYDGSAKFTIQSGFEMMVGGGFGAIALTKTEVTFQDELGLKWGVRDNGGNSYISTMANTERWETSDAPIYTGSMGDIFIARSSNIVFGRSKKLGFLNNQDTLKLGIEDIMTYQPEFGTMVQYSQYQIINEVIPDLTRSRDAMLKKYKDSYILHKQPEDDNYLFNTTVEVKDTLIVGDAYTYIIPQQLRINNDKQCIDSVGLFANAIYTWQKHLAANEEAKKLAFDNRQENLIDNYTFDGGVKLSHSVKNEDGFKRNNSLQLSFAGFHQTQLTGKFAGSGGVVTINTEIGVESQYDYEHEETNYTEYGFTLADENKTDYYSVDVYKGENGYSPIYRVRGGQTSCPYQGKELTSYYKPGDFIINDPTARVEEPKIGIAQGESFYKANIPSNKAAFYKLRLSNNSQSERYSIYNLQAPTEYNPNGAIVKVDGVSIRNGLDVYIEAGQTVEKIISIEAGNPSVLDYNDIVVALVSNCEFYGDSIRLTARFTPSCTPVNIVSPNDKWVINSNSGKDLNIEMTDYDVNFAPLQQVDLKYRPTSSSVWKPLKTYFKDSAGYKLSTLLDEYKGVLGNSKTNYIWDISSEFDREYELIASATCINNGTEIVQESEIIRGIKDTKRPQVYGQPQPADQILSPGDQISIRFNEPIEADMISKDDIVIRSVLNGSPIDHSASLELNGTSSYAYAEGINFAGKSFTVEFWMKRPEPNHAGVIISKGSTESEKFEFAFNQEGKIQVTLGANTFTESLKLYITAESPADTWHHYAVAYNAELKTLNVYADDKITIAKTQVEYAPTLRSALFIGCTPEKTNYGKAYIHDLRYWNDALDQGYVYAYMYETLSGFEKNLLSYWLLNETEGNTAADRAGSLTLNVSANRHLDRKAYAASFDNSRLTVDTTFSLLDVQDATIEFWFRASTPTDTTCLFYNGVRDTMTTAGYNDVLAVYACPDGNVTIQAKNSFFNASTNHYLDGNWHHFALVLDRLTNIRCYVDGSLQCQANKNLIDDLPMSKMSIGAKYALLYNNSFTTTKQFNGEIDEFRLWESARTEKLIAQNRFSQLDGDEDGLLLYFPFEKYGSMMGIQTTDTDYKNHSNVNANVAVYFGGSHTESTPPVKAAEYYTNYSKFDFVVNSDEIIINLDDNDAARYENCIFEISVKDVQDKFGNKQASPAQWTAYVNKSNVVWEQTAVAINAKKGESQTFTATVINKSGIVQPFTISGLPAWLSVSDDNGSLQPEERKELTFTVSDALNIGTFEQIIYVTSEMGYNEKLTITANVTLPAPDWSVDPSAYQYTMNLFGTVHIGGEISTDPNDVVAVFVGGTCRGVAKLTYLNEFGLAEAMLNIYSNSASGEKLQIKVWDASNGIIYTDVNPVITFEDQSIVGSPKAPEKIICGNNVEVTYDLTKGWNWISVNVQNSKGNTSQNVFGSIASAANELKARDSYYDNTGKNASGVYTWSGTLTANGGMHPETMYKLNMKKAAIANISGSVIDPQTDTITLAAGWNWIGFLPLETISVDEALAPYGPADGDVIKSQKAFSMYYEQLGWIGTLNAMEPGKGYMLNTSNNSKLIYPQKSGLKSSVIDENVSSYTDAINYKQNTATMIVAVNDNIAGLGQETIAAYNNGELAGIAQPMVYDGKTFYFISITGDKTGSIVFKTKESGTEFDNQITFVADQHTGSIQHPYILTVNNNKDIYADVNTVSPNPFHNTLTVTYYSAAGGSASIALTNGLGSMIASKEVEVIEGKNEIRLDKIFGQTFMQLPSSAYQVSVKSNESINIFSVVKE